MIVAITGGTGFIGRKLAQRHLARGDEVRILSRRQPSECALPPSVKLFRGDLAGGADLAPLVEQADVLYHCAGEIRDVGRMEALHVTGTLKLIEAATGRIGRWVQLSSVGVYGQPRSGTVTEQSPLKPRGVYETTKMRSDELVRAAGKRGAFEWAILRPSIVFGEGMPNQSLFEMFKVIDQGKFFLIGPAGASANYIHVDNVVHALTLCAALPGANGRIFNLSDYATLEAFASMIAGALGRGGPRLRVPEFAARLIAATGTRVMERFPLTGSRIDAMTTRAAYPMDAIRQALGYCDEISLEAGVVRLAQSWSAQRRAAAERTVRA